MPSSYVTGVNLAVDGGHSDHGRRRPAAGPVAAVEPPRSDQRRWPVPGHHRAAARDHPRGHPRASTIRSRRRDAPRRHRELVHRYSDGVTRRDVAQWTSCWADDATLVDQRGPHGRRPRGDRRPARACAGLTGRRRAERSARLGDDRGRRGGPAGGTSSSTTGASAARPRLLLAHYDDTYVERRGPLAVRQPHARSFLRRPARPLGHVHTRSPHDWSTRGQGRRGHRRRERHRRRHGAAIRRGGRPRGRRRRPDRRREAARSRSSAARPDSSRPTWPRRATSPPPSTSRSASSGGSTACSTTPGSSAPSARSPRRRPQTGTAPSRCCSARSSSGMKHAARVMVPQRSGVILSTSSTAGIIGGLGPHAYTACKHAVVGLTRSVAAELAPHGVRVNAIAPGNTVTGMTAVAYTGERGRPRCHGRADQGGIAARHRGRADRHRQRRALPRERRGQVRHRPVPRGRRR